MSDGSEVDGRESGGRLCMFCESTDGIHERNCPEVVFNRPRRGRPPSDPFEGPMRVPDAYGKPEHAKVKSLDAAEAKIQELERKVRLRDDQVTTIAEVSRLYPQLFRKLLSAMDLSDEWWHRGRDLTIGTWAQRIAALPEAELFEERRERR